MNKTINDGGPAFPRTAYSDPSFSEKDEPGQRGITTRDYFAAKAMQGMLANSRNEGTRSLLAGFAYEQADAMLAERSKP